MIQKKNQKMVLLNVASQKNKNYQNLDRKTALSKRNNAR